MNPDTDLILKKFEEHNDKDREQFEGINTRLGTIDDNVTLVLNAVAGNEPMGQEGLVSRVKKLEDRDINRTAKENIKNGVMLVLGFIGSAMMALLITWLETKFSK